MPKNLAKIVFLTALISVTSSQADIFQDLEFSKKLPPPPDTAAKKPTQKQAASTKHNPGHVTTPNNSPLPPGKKSNSRAQGSLDTFLHKFPFKTPPASQKQTHSTKAAKKTQTKK